MQLQQLRYFLEIAKEQSISLAAKNLYLSQPSLSQQIMKLEQELGIPLLIRHSKSVSLTDAGEQFAQHAKRIVGGVDQLSELMQKHSIMQAGTLQIGLLWIAGYTNLLQILNDYHRMYPNLNYSLKIEGSSTLLQMLLDRSIHAAFVISTEPQLKQEPSFYYQKIHEDHYVAVVSTQNPLSAKSILTIGDLRDETIIMPAKASAFRKQLENIFEEHGFTPHILCETSQSDLLIQLASHNCAIGFSSKSIAQSLKTDAFNWIPMDFTVHRSIYYVTLKELLDYPSISNFTRYIRRFALR